MFTATKIKSTIKPAKFESLNNGIWYYNYDIVEKTVMTRDMITGKDKEVPIYSFVQVRINGKPTLSKCYEAILKVYTDESGTSLYDAIESNDTLKEVAEEIYYAIKVDFGLAEEISPLDKAKKNILKKIDKYDKSANVNSFFLNGVKVWLDKNTRVGLQNSITIEKEAGKTETTLWFNGMKIVVRCTLALQMLSILELYALNCYNKTAEHKNNVQNLTTLEEVLSYDYTQGYPDKPVFNV